MPIKMYETSSNAFENTSPKSNPGQQGLHLVGVNTMLIKRASAVRDEQGQMGAVQDSIDDIIDDLTNAWPVGDDTVDDGIAS